MAAQAPGSPVSPGPSPALAARAADLIPLLNGETAPELLFSPAMLASVPADQIRATGTQLTARYGKAIKISRIEPATRSQATIAVAFERSTLLFGLYVDPASGKISGLAVRGEDVGNESAAAVLAEFRALPGLASVSVAALDPAGPRRLEGVEPGRVMAIGSAFKLFILAELIRSVKAGERKWTDVAMLDHRSLPSGILQDWPRASPLTIYSLAALMISRSDNSAADTLLHLAGREKAEAMQAVLGLAEPARNRPFLSTRELFAIKADPSLTAKWTSGDESARRAMLPPLADSAIDIDALGGPPKAISTVEWFASPEDLVRVMDWIRRNADREALEILSINPGLGADDARHFDYFGYKGGSETGVIEMTFLLRRKDGEWRAVAASWNNPAAAVDEARFVPLMRRLVALQR
jgi:beta-lactamase class A